MTSVVIAAHNEEAVIGRCLDALLAEDGGLDITVVANGCGDRTAAVRSAHPLATTVMSRSSGSASNASRHRPITASSSWAAITTLVIG